MSIDKTIVAPTSGATYTLPSPSPVTHAERRAQAIRRLMASATHDLGMRCLAVLSLLRLRSAAAEGGGPQ